MGLNFFFPYMLEAIIAELIARVGQLDVLINNASMMQESRIEALSLEN